MMRILTDINYISDRPTSVALGTFDGVHIGHRAVIRAAVTGAAEEGLIPAVFTFSDLPKNAFLPEGGRIRPLCTASEKAALMEELGVELLLTPPFSEEIRDMPAGDFIREVLIGRLKARRIVCGYDHHFGRFGAGDPEMLLRVCRGCGAAVTVIPPVTVNGTKVSSTLIRSLIENGRSDEAEALLGRPLRSSPEK